MAKAKNNAASSALASLKGKKPPAKPAAKAKAAKLVAKVKAPKAKAAPKKKAVKPQMVHKPKPVAAPESVKPAGDVYALVHQCWTLWTDGPHPMTDEEYQEFQPALNVVTAYGSKLCVPTIHAAAKLEALRRFLAGEVEPPPRPKAWEPCPPAVQRLIAGECEPGTATWILHGTLWEFQTGWDEPRRKENTQPEDWHHTGEVKPLPAPEPAPLAEGETNTVVPPEPTTVPASDPEPEAVAETLCVVPEPAAADEHPEPAEVAPAQPGDVDL